MSLTIMSLKRSNGCASTSLGFQRDKVSTRYVNSEFLGKSSAVDVLQKFEDASFISYV